jgi:hypothetical protein
MALTSRGQPVALSELETAVRAAVMVVDNAIPLTYGNAGPDPDKLRLRAVALQMTLNTLLDIDWVPDGKYAEPA